MSLKHPLPSSQSNFAQTFRQLCRVVPVGALPEMKERVQLTVKKMEILSEGLLGPNLVLARELAQRSLMLLDRYDVFKDYQKALCVGALLYFLAQKDLKGLAVNL